jgi:predicted N-acetyltransferase YhbS
MAMGEPRQVSGAAMRTCQPGDEQIILDLLKNAFGSTEYIPRVKAEISGPYFNREGSLIAEKNGSALGCVGLRNFPHEKWLDIRYLAVRDSESKVQLAQAAELKQNISSWKEELSS